MPLVVRVDTLALWIAWAFGPLSGTATLVANHLWPPAENEFRTDEMCVVFAGQGLACVFTLWLLVLRERWRRPHLAALVAYWFALVLLLVGTAWPLREIRVVGAIAMMAATAVFPFLAVRGRIRSNS